MKFIFLFLISQLNAAQAVEPKASSAHHLFSKISPQVYQVKTALSTDSPKAGYGSGFSVAKNGLVMTNFHVISSVIMEEKGYKIFVEVDKRWLPAQILAVDVVHDLALLSVGQSFKDFLKFRNTPLSQGSRIYSFGLPEDLNLSIVEGTYNGVIHHGPYQQIHVSSPINSGMSGGPATDNSGQVMGINVSTIIDSNNISFLVPAEWAVRMLNQHGKIDGSKMSSEDHQKQIRDQLEDVQNQLIHLFTDTNEKKFTLGDWQLNRVADPLKCWSNNSDDEKKRFTSVEHKCFVDQSTFLKDDYQTSTFSITYRTIKKRRLNPLQFYHILNDVYNGGDLYHDVMFSSFEYTDEFLTRYDCSEQTLKNQFGVTLKTNYCLRGYLKFPKIYDLYLKGITLSRRNEEIVFYSQLNGFTLENIQKFSRLILDQIAPIAGGSQP